MKHLFTIAPIVQLGNAGISFSKNISIITLPVLFDLIFVFLYGFSTDFFSKRMQEASYSLFQVVGQNSLQISKDLLTNNNLLSVLQAQPNFSLYYEIIVHYFILSFIALFGIFFITQVFAWKYSSDLVQKKIRFKEYAGTFFILSTIWFGIGFILQTSLKIVQFFFQITHKGTDQISSFGLFYVFFFLLFYFGLISYSLIESGSIVSILKKTFYFGIKKIHLFLLCFGIITLFFLTTDFILMKLYPLFPKFTIVFGLIILFPLITFSRMYLYLTAREISHDI